MKHIVEIENWVRRDNYLYFKNFANPWIAITSEVECSRAFYRAKENGSSFFLHYLYAVARAVNEIKELRYRIDKEGNVVWHDNVDVISPIAVPGRTFYTVRIPYKDDFASFYREARHIITHIPHDGDPYATDKAIAEAGDYDVFLLSATPKLYFTGVTYTQMATGHSMDYPLMNAGKAITRGDKLYMPIALTVSHAFVDGEHISQFFEKVQAFLNEIHL